jgi:Flp pilus assembly protein TadG
MGSHTSKRRRSGAATVEFAICLPLLTLFCFGTIEACSMIQLKQSLQIAAYEGGRTANAIGATTADVEATCNQILADRGITGGSVMTGPSEVASAQAGDYFTVQCAAPTNSNSLIPPWFFAAGSTLAGQAEFVKKY